MKVLFTNYKSTKVEIKSCGTKRTQQTSVIY